MTPTSRLEAPAAWLAFEVAAELAAEEDPEADEPPELVVVALTLAAPPVLVPEDPEATAPSLVQTPRSVESPLSVRLGHCEIALLTRVSADALYQDRTCEVHEL